MKSFARPSFFRAFDLLLSTSNPGLRKSRWSVGKVGCERERYSFASARHEVVIEIFTLTFTGARSWSLMVAKEYWSSGTNSIRNTRWAKPLHGNRVDILHWMQAQEASLMRELPGYAGRAGESAEAEDIPSLAGEARRVRRNSARPVGSYEP
jgi:hypothetical protein